MIFFPQCMRAVQAGSSPDLGLHFAALRNSTGILEALLSVGANVNVIMFGRLGISRFWIP